MDIEEVAHKTPEKIIKVFVDPLAGLSDAQALELARGIGVPQASQAEAMDVFSTSLGWITSGPSASQRVAPLRVMPNTAVATSSTSPAAYSGTASCCSFCGGTCATTNSTASASSMLRPWSTKRVPWS